MSRRISLALTRADQAKNPYFYVPFEVPEGTTRIDVKITYQKAKDSIIDLGVLDPRAGDYPTSQGFRGWSGGARDRFFVARDDATPGYIHGEIPTGQWRVMLGLYQVPETGATLDVEIDLDRAPRTLLPQPKRTLPVRSERGWYRGDLHCHTWHSDAKGSPELLHAAAKQAGLDFLAICDHNTTTQRRYFYPASSPELVFVRGMEVTTATGHANVYGVDAWIDFRMTKPSDAHTLAKEVHERGGLLSINHDKPTIPWDYELPKIDCMEVWQSSWFAWNWISLARYQERLASGLRISLIGGSDYHQPDQLEPEGVFVLARPTTVLALDELSEDAVLAAMKAGRGFVTENPRGPHLSIEVGGAPMGGSVKAGRLEAEAVVKDALGDRLVWIGATGVVLEEEIKSDDWIGGYAGAPQKFLRAEIVADASRERLVTEFMEALDGAGLPWDLQDADLEDHPVRRALSNPVYLD